MSTYTCILIRGIDPLTLEKFIILIKVGVSITPDFFLECHLCG